MTLRAWLLLYGAAASVALVLLLRTTVGMIQAGQITMSAPTKRGLWLIYVSMFVQALQGAICWPLQLFGVALGYIVGKLDQRDCEP